MLSIALLVGSAVAIYLASELFVNAVEHLGRLLRVGTLAVGTVLAAIGTALPESVVTGVAVTRGGSDEIGMGAALGGPLALTTIAYAAVGLALLARRQSLPRIRTRSLARDQAVFLGLFAVELGLGLVAFAWKPWLGLAFFACYAVYVTRELRSGSAGHEEHEAETLRLTRTTDPGLPAVLLQTVATLAVVFLASQVFVGRLGWAGQELGLAPAVVALLLSPVATELPEVMNALIWARQGKAQLALSNISGSMMVQVTVPGGLGIAFTNWELERPLVLSGMVTAGAVTYLLVTVLTGRLSARRLAATGGGYAVLALLLVFS